MAITEIILNIHSGAVRDVFSSDSEVRVLAVDWDTAGAEPGDPGIVPVDLESRTDLAAVYELHVSKLGDLAGTDVEGAIEAAFATGVLQEQELEPAAV